MIFSLEPRPANAACIRSDRGGGIRATERHIFAIATTTVQVLAPRSPGPVDRSKGDLAATKIAPAQARLGPMTPPAAESLASRRFRSSGSHLKHVQLPVFGPPT